MRAARALQRIAATPETEEFYDELHSLMEARDRLEKASDDALPRGEAAEFDEYDGCKRQACESVEALLELGSASQEALDDFGRTVAAEAGATYEGARLKCLSRLSEKLERDYDGDCGRCVDVARGSVVADDEATVCLVSRRVAKGGSGAQTGDSIALPRESLAISCVREPIQLSRT